MKLPIKDVIMKHLLKDDTTDDFVFCMELN